MLFSNIWRSINSTKPRSWAIWFGWLCNPSPYLFLWYSESSLFWSFWNPDACKFFHKAFGVVQSLQNYEIRQSCLADSATHRHTLMWTSREKSRVFCSIEHYERVCRDAESIKSCDLGYKKSSSQIGLVCDVTTWTKPLESMTEGRRETFERCWIRNEKRNWTLNLKNNFLLMFILHILS